MNEWIKLDLCAWTTYLYRQEHNKPQIYIGPTWPHQLAGTSYTREIPPSEVFLHYLNLGHGPSWMISPRAAEARTKELLLRQGRDQFNYSSQAKISHQFPSTIKPSQSYLHYYHVSQHGGQQDPGREHQTDGKFTYFPNNLSYK